MPTPVRIVRIPLRGPWFRLLGGGDSIEVRIEDQEGGSIVYVPAFAIALSRERAVATAVGSVLAAVAEKVVDRIMGR